MTSNVELLPLPKWMESFVIPGDAHGDQTLSDRMTAYALANVLHHTAFLRYALDSAARDIKTLRGVRDAQAAEIKALRADVGRLQTKAAGAVDAARGYQRELAREYARAERLAEALRKIAELRERHHDNLHDAVTIAEEALRDSEAASG